MKSLPLVRPKSKGCKVKIMADLKINSSDKMLIIQLAGIGDLVMASPTLRALRAKYPNAKIAFLSLARTKDMIRHCPYIDRVFTFEEKLSPGTIWRNLQAILKIRREHFDVAANLHNLYSSSGTAKMCFLLFLIKAKKTVGRNTNAKGAFYDVKVDDSMPLSKHQVECIMDVARALHCRADNYKLEVWAPKEEDIHVFDFIEKESGAKGRFTIGINLGGIRPSRRWPVENFAKVADVLSEKYNAQIVITGSKSEIKLAQDMQRMMRATPIISSGVFSLTQLVAFIRRCDLFISNDSGPMHIANALEKPLVAIIGPGYPQVRPYNKQNCIVLKKEVACSPCYKFDCKSLECLKSIKVNDVLEAVTKLLPLRG
ncbi:MAG: glycosyltransferase family 9 protein [Candidatus Omnitrophica bacterium]|nr:glycosyltransferase family 9 protein [Candidatus Omnitrophota bacterium]